MRYLNKFLIMLSLFASTSTVVCEEISGVDSNQFNVEFLFGHKFKQEKSFGSNKYLEHYSADEFIRLKAVKYKSNDFARIYVGDRMALFYSVFDEKRVDYPGQYSKTISCPEEFKPKLFEIAHVNGFTTYYSGYANKNKTTGACVADLINYKYSYGFIFCPKNRSLIEFEHYSALNSDIFESFRGELICD